MSDQFRIDSHKLHLHPQRVAEWERSGDAFPLYMEVSPVGACNHRCTFCGVDFMGYQSRRLELELFQRLLPELGQLGLKSIMFAGEGEPLLHPDIAAIAEATKAAGIDVAFTTNATLLKPALAERLLPVTSWIKTSINAGTAATYAAIHRTKESDFAKVVAQMTAAAELKRQHGWRCALGMQAVLLPENWDEMELLAGISRDAGMDYLVVKPYSQHTQGLQDAYAGVRYDAAAGLAERLAGYATASFKPLVRLNTMRKWDEAQRPYQRCQALPFWSYIDAGGEVWGCSIYLKDERFRYGNVREQGFAAIWQGELRRKSLDFVHNHLDISGCRVNCRMDEINRYLWELKHPQDHVNFI
jgi:MoaA/NifB/PqqE/SkfB family radical SAM enzyme